MGRSADLPGQPLIRGCCTALSFATPAMCDGLRPFSDPTEDLRTLFVSTPTPPPVQPSTAGPNPPPGSQLPQPVPDREAAEPGGATGPEHPGGNPPEPGSHKAGGKQSGEKKSGGFGQLPDTIRLLLQIWLVVLGVEVAHQILSVVMSLLDTSALRAAAREMLSPEQAEQVGEGVLNSAAIASVVLSALLAIAFMGLLAWMLHLVKTRSRRAPVARRLLLVFGFYFAFRVLLIFMLTPGGSDVPVALFAVDGSLQIIAGVAAVLALILGFRSETLKWTGEIPGDGPGDSGPNSGGDRRSPPNNQEK